ncbi:amino-acid racemase [Enterococcus sp. JM4C]|uniref:YhfX family PLP-dependent enzyme n=1 Tax=Candidatus Enterococcus huntleyi TaxID=1857217 RepID=UPI00137967DF|nr:YhfX family PLP-dependent enzyme [Enterococcus sp. JM4C]KAF1299357.1 amino-acid racemase [Enterococcus sp. JM4C]
MFLPMMKQENPALIDAGIHLHQSGQILPDTYILDLDTIVSNGTVMLERAKKDGIDLFFMLKQIGRNPLIAKELMAIGYRGAVVVDFKEALLMMENHIPLCNVGHLVQIPDSLLEKIMLYGTEYMTVYSLEKLEKIQIIAKKHGMKQKVLLKVVDDEDQIYEGQFGGFLLKRLAEESKLFHRFDAIEFSGITSFPCFLFDDRYTTLEQTNNVKTIEAAKKILCEEGFPVSELNVPSASCSATIPFIKQIGGTQAEPGHALTGTTPLHAYKKQPEKPALLYVSEISHNFKGKSYFYGGGYYRRGHLNSVLVGDVSGQVEDQVEHFSDESIDYYLSTPSEHPVGETVIAAFRTQIFVTRSDVAVVKGISQGKPEILGIFDSRGRRI